MFWLIGIGVVIVAFIIIKFAVSKAANPDSTLGVLEHPSTFKKQNIEMVDKSLKANKDES